MKIVSWNCHYGLSKEKAEIIMEAFKDADIFIIQECKQVDINAFKCDWKFRNWYGDDLDENSDLGIALFSKSYKIEFTCEFNRKFRYVVPYKIITENDPLTLFAVWTKSAKRGEFDYIQNITKAVDYYGTKGILDSNVIIIGDYNTGYNRDSDENINRYFNLEKKLKGFKNISPEKPEEYLMTYIHSNGKEYLNDFCFVSKEFNGKDINFTVHNDWKDMSEQKCWPALSDHCPISIEFN
jgi:endonuclease/exonuclease/phosphatase family metal-dependent hydrolase